MNLLAALLGIPAGAAVLVLLPFPIAVVGRLNVLCMLATLLTAGAMVPLVLAQGTLEGLHHFLRVDALSCLMVLLVSLTSFLASFYSVGYWESQPREERGSDQKIRGYYALVNLFVMSMLVVCTTDNLGVLWVALEATTLASAFLVGFYNKEASLQAAWRYLIICSLGISFALIGVVLAFASAVSAAGFHEYALNWSYLTSIADQLDPTALKLAFGFAVVGFGTKAGLVPMHGWLPDAHSEAPTPVSALLSGVLLKCALYALIRFAILVNHGIGDNFSGSILMPFGFLSVGIAALYLFGQTQIKRLLGYSSIEHVGVITIGLSFGSPLAVFGALFHMWNHAMTKSLLFFTAGNLYLCHHTLSMQKITGSLRLTTGTGIALLVGGLALSGTPPFSIFISEFSIVSAGIQLGYWVAPLLLIVLLVVIFAGLFSQLSRMAFGLPSEDAQDHEPSASPPISSLTAWALVIPMGFIVLMGWFIPGPLFELFSEGTRIITGDVPVETSIRSWRGNVWQE